MVRYEDLDADPVGVARDILDFLGLRLPPGRLIKTQNRRLADELNAQWIDRYRSELTERLDTVPESRKTNSFNTDVTLSEEYV